MNFEHIPVLLKETLAQMNLSEGMIAVDCTVGLGGHSSYLLAAVGQSGTVVGIDQDPEALAIAGKRLATEYSAGNFRPKTGRFSEFERLTTECGVFGKINGILADIGVSSMQLDNPERGFSFMNDGPLDMRMDKTRNLTAADLVNTMSDAELAKIFWEYGEEPKSRMIAAKIVRAREVKPFLRTLELADFVKKELRYPKPSKKHPATKIFQALRIEVNAELEELKMLLQAAFEGLAPGGRLAVISFHSLEDRIIKHTMQQLTAQHRQQSVPKGLPVTSKEMEHLVDAKGRIIKPFPAIPSELEQKENSRARSAKLRVIEKL